MKFATHITDGLFFNLEIKKSWEFSKVLIDKVNDKVNSKGDSKGNLEKSITGTLIVEGMHFEKDNNGKKKNSLLSHADST